MKKENVNKIYGETLKEFRVKNNLTQEQAAQLAKVDAKYVSQIERGVATGTITTMLNFCEAYGITPNDVFNKIIKDSKVQNEINTYTEKLMNLSKRDRNLIYNLMDNMLDNQNKKD